MKTIHFLHGYGQNAELFQQYNSKLLSRLSKKYNLIYSQGQYPAPDYGKSGRSWWETKDVYGDLIHKHDVVSNVLIDNIKPCDILCGYSQGGNVVLHCLEKNPKICQVAIIINSLRGNVNSMIETPIIYIFGEGDPFVKQEHRDDLLHISLNHQVIIHNKGHHIPQNITFSQKIMDTIDTILNNGSDIYIY